jgi:hypothetical protein
MIPAGCDGPWSRRKMLFSLRRASKHRTKRASMARGMVPTWHVFQIPACVLPKKKHVHEIECQDEQAGGEGWRRDAREVEEDDALRPPLKVPW